MISNRYRISGTFNYGSTVRAPLLGGSPEHREAFRQYTIPFSNSDFEDIRKVEKRDRKE